MFDVELRGIGEQEWLPFLDEPADQEYAEVIKRGIEKNYPQIETRIVPWNR